MLLTNDLRFWILRLKKKKVKVSLNSNASDQIKVEKPDGLITTAEITQQPSFALSETLEIPLW